MADVSCVRKSLEGLRALKRRRVSLGLNRDQSSSSREPKPEPEPKPVSVPELKPTADADAGAGAGAGPGRNRVPPPYRLKQKPNPTVGGRPMNDYSQHYTDTGLRPQNYVRGHNLSERYTAYPQLRELHRLANALVRQKAHPPMYLKCDLKEVDLASLLPCRFDAVVIDPPLEEYVRRQPTLHLRSSSWTFEDVRKLNVGRIISNPGFLFLWCGSAEGLEEGRKVMRSWGFRRVEDICWVKTNKVKERGQGQGHGTGFIADQSSIFTSTIEHCLMGIRGNVNRDADQDLVHANMDSDLIISEEIQGTQKPEELYEIIERFCMGLRRLELFGEDHNIRPGWLTIGDQLSLSNFNAETYASYFSGGKLLGTTATIEQLRPRSQR